MNKIAKPIGASCLVGHGHDPENPTVRIVESTYHGRNPGDKLIQIETNGSSVVLSKGTLQYILGWVDRLEMI